MPCYDQYLESFILFINCTKCNTVAVDNEAQSVCLRVCCDVLALPSLQHPWVVDILNPFLIQFVMIYLAMNPVHTTLHHFSVTLTAESCYLTSITALTSYAFQLVCFGFTCCPICRLILSVFPRLYFALFSFILLSLLNSSFFSSSISPSLFILLLPLLLLSLLSSSFFSSLLSPFLSFYLSLSLHSFPDNSWLCMTLHEVRTITASNLLHNLSILLLYMHSYQMCVCTHGWCAPCPSSRTEQRRAPKGTLHQVRTLNIDVNKLQFSCHHSTDLSLLHYSKA